MHLKVEEVDDEKRLGQGTRSGVSHHGAEAFPNEQHGSRGSAGVVR